MSYPYGFHEFVPHPDDFLEVQGRRILRANDALLDWLTRHVLASVVVFDLALILPLLVLPMPDDIKLTLGVISGSWFQWWALPALQRAAVKDAAKANAKAEADHRALTHIAHTVDALARKMGATP